MSEIPPILLVLATFPDVETARRIARILVSEQLAACVNLFPQIESIYIWEEKLETSQEVAAWIKTTPESYPTLQARYKELHPYDVPALVAIPVQNGLPDYLRWVAENCGT